MKGKLYGVGIGPGDPELLTLKALRVIRESKVIALPGKEPRETVAYKIVEGAYPEIAEKELLAVDMPMTKDPAKLEASHEAGAAAIMAYLDKGMDVAFPTLGDPTVYSTYIYIHRRVVNRGYGAEIIPGVPSFCAVAARLNQPLCEKAQRLMIVPASHGEVEDCLSVDANLVFMKAGRELGALRDTLAAHGLLERASMVANCGMEGETVCPRFADVPEGTGYFSVVLVKKGEPT